ncbi:glycosyltransferase involved in cell wall biosynthesis [Desulfobotulus alkaliphilus]|uniref:Glycosyltransferase involved in cell wall biosynthesis n=1 Tax=Desulfobotulus alkaliphilus TaxID=622671 RepID=A0A562S8Z7_9BACT|nr:glycosyltransferase [Desulfobotulus alkaliphilus]TWI76906.1 glycosyltransferase involved in cell wall biosynthesis [Desulfobotulus alkaliphilus]
MKKILYIVSTLQRSGPTNQLYNLIKYLDRNEFEPYLITLSPEPEHGSAWQAFNDLGVSMQSLGLSRIKGFFFSKRRLKVLVDKIRPDVVHTQGIRADSLSSAALGDYSCLCTSRNYPYEDYPSKFGRFPGVLMAWQHFMAFRKLQVAACSSAIQKRLKRHGIKAVTIQNGVDTDNFSPVSADQKSALRNKLSLPGDARIFLSVGSLIPRKDMQTIIAAFKKTMTDDLIKYLVVLGDGPLMEQLQGMVDKEMILLAGSVDNVRDYLGAADVFVSSALSEGLPNTVLEAMACGLPSILSDIPPHRELFEDGGAFFFPCKDVGKLASLFEVMKQSETKKAGMKAYETLNIKFAADKMSQKYQNLYMEMGSFHNGRKL